MKIILLGRRIQSKKDSELNQQEIHMSSLIKMEGYSGSNEEIAL